MMAVPDPIILLILFSLMLPYDQCSISQREPLTRIIRNRCIERSMPDRDARRCGDDPANVLPIPHLNAEG